MFEREAHRRVVAVLRSLRTEVLAGCGFLFGGGTRIALDLDEFRESQDIDFLCSNASGYGDLRFQATSRSYAALFDDNAREGLSFPREMRVDQYGIRFPVLFEGATLKIELIREARIELSPGVRPDWSPVACLAPEDCYAEKLLANSDRWADRQVLSRDLLDLAALRTSWGPIPEIAWSKSEAAYRSAPLDDLRKSLAALERDPEYRDRCLTGLAIDDPARLLDGLEALRRDLS